MEKKNFLNSRQRHRTWNIDEMDFWTAVHVVFLDIFHEGSIVKISNWKKDMVVSFSFLEA